MNKRVFIVLVLFCLLFTGISASATMAPGLCDDQTGTLQAATRLLVTTTPAMYRATTSPPSTGTLKLDSTPPGASVYVDGALRGTTPVTSTLSVGSHTVVLKMAGFYDYSRTVTITAGGLVQETWNLVPVTTPPTTPASRVPATTSSDFANSFPGPHEFTTTTTPVPSGNTRSVANHSDFSIVSPNTGGNVSLRSGTNTSAEGSSVRVRKGASSGEALVALQMAVGKIPYDTSYDLNHDGVVNSADAREILRLSVQGSPGG